MNGTPGDLDILCLFIQILGPGIRLEIKFLIRKRKRKIDDIFLEISETFAICFIHKLMLILWGNLTFVNIFLAQTDEMFPLLNFVFTFDTYLEDRFLDTFEPK